MLLNVVRKRPIRDFSCSILCKKGNGLSGVWWGKVGLACRQKLYLHSLARLSRSSLVGRRHCRRLRPSLPSFPEIHRSVEDPMPRVEKKKLRRSFGRRRKAWDPISRSIVPRIPDDVRVVAPRPQPEVGWRRHDDAVDLHDGDRAAGMGGRRRTDDDNDDDDCRNASGSETGLDSPPPAAAPAITAASIGNGGDDDGIIAVSASFGRKKKEGGGGRGGRAGRNRHRPKDGRRVVLGDRSNVLPANDAAAQTGDSKRESFASFRVVMSISLFQKSKSSCPEFSLRRVCIRNQRDIRSSIVRARRR